MGATPWIALGAGVAGGADVIHILEIAYDLGEVAARIRERESRGARFGIVDVAQGAKPVGGTTTIKAAARPGVVERLGGVGQQVADRLQGMTGKESRCVVLGHLQHGGSPTPFDRVLATRFGAKAVELVHRGVFGRMVTNTPRTSCTSRSPTSSAAPIRCRSTTPCLRRRAVGVSLGD